MLAELAHTQLSCSPQRASVQTASVDADSRPAAALLLPAGRLIDAQEKQRCALLMQFKGSVPAPSAQLTPAGRVKVAAARARCTGLMPGSLSDREQLSAQDAAIERMASQRAALQQRFQEVEQEVVEREEFVAGMRGLGRLQQEQLAAMRAEAAGKVEEMRVLDGRIRALDVQLRDAYKPAGLMRWGCAQH